MRPGNTEPRTSLVGVFGNKRFSFISHVVVLPGEVIVSDGDGRNRSWEGITGGTRSVSCAELPTSSGLRPSLKLSGLLQGQNV